MSRVLTAAELLDGGTERRHRVRSAKFAEPLVIRTPPMWMPSGLLAGAFLLSAAALAGRTPGCGMISSLTLVLRSSLMMKRA